MTLSPESLRHLPAYARMAEAAYRRKLETKEWESWSDWQKWTRELGGEPFRYGATSGFVAKLERENRVVVSFRGTESDSITDILTDIKGLPQRLCCRVKVHQGAYDALMEVIDEVLYLLRPYKQLPVDFTGHSLGGMLAQLCAFELLGRGYELGRLITFGSPPAGNQAFSSALCAVLSHEERMMARVVRCADIVPRLKTMYLMGYRNANGLVFLDRQNRVWTKGSSTLFRFTDRQIARLNQKKMLDVPHHSMTEYRKILEEYYT